MSVEQVAAIFETPEAPVWSSQVIDSLVDGEDRSKSLQATIRQVDQIVGGRNEPLTEIQTAFVRDITARNYVGKRVLLTRESLDWLVEAFDARPTAIRALILTMLVRFDTLPKVLRKEITKLLSGSPAEAWLQDAQEERPRT